MKTIRDLFNAIHQGVRPVMTVRKGIEEKEGYAEAGMRARLTAARETPDSDVLVITLDFTDFETHNKPYERANYYDKSGSPTLTAREAGFYRPSEDYYFDLGERVEDHFEVVSGPSLALYGKFQKAVEAGFGGSYVAWLEGCLEEALTRQGE